jgi:hypothetical protein
VDNVAYPADFRGLPKFIHRCLLFAVGSPKSLDRDLGPNLGTEFEAIRYGFGRTVDAKLHPIEPMNLDTKVKGRLREVCNSNGRKVDLGNPGFGANEK